SAAAAALKNARGRGIVLTGPYQPPELHAVVHRINAALGNTGVTMIHTDPVLAQAESFKGLIDAMHHGEVDMLIPNQVYTAPADAGFPDLLRQVGLKLHASPYVAETALHCDWHMRLLHPL